MASSCQPSGGPTTLDPRVPRIGTRLPPNGSATQHWVLTLSCPDRPGIVHAVAGLLAEHGGNITESQQFGDPLSGLFFMRVQVESASPRAELTEALAELAGRFSMTWELDLAGRPVRTLVMGSTAAHCLNDLAFRQRSEKPAGRDRRGGLQPHRAGRPGRVLRHPVPPRAGHPGHQGATPRPGCSSSSGSSTSSSSCSRATCRSCPTTCAGGCPDGSSTSTTRSCRRSRAPARTPRRTSAGVKLIGATAHYVTGDLDEGPIIEQDVERVDHSRTVDDLVALGQDVERRALARAVRWHAEHRVLLNAPPDHRLPLTRRRPPATGTGRPTPTTATLRPLPAREGAERRRGPGGAAQSSARTRTSQAPSATLAARARRRRRISASVTATGTGDRRRLPRPVVHEPQPPARAPRSPTAP